MARAGRPGATGPVGDPHRDDQHEEHPDRVAGGRTTRSGSSTYRLRRGSGGAGRYPGGEGIERELAFDVAATVSLMGERRRAAPWGLAGGEPGRLR